MRGLTYVTAMGGVIALAGAAALPWFLVPVGLADGELTALAPGAASAYRVLCVIVALLVGFTVTFTVASEAVLRLTAVWLIALLLFPYFAMVWDERVAAESSWLQMQHENATWLGGDLFTSAEHGDGTLKARVYPVDPPRRLRVFRVPTAPPWKLELANGSDLLDWLGYTEAFCQFCRKGWFAALLGTAVILAAVCVADRDCQRERIIRSIWRMALVGAAAVVIAWSLPFAAGWYVADAEEQARQGDYEVAVDRLSAATRIVPTLRHDSSFVAQVGRLDHILGRDTIEARLHLATRFEAEGRYGDANDRYRSVLHEAAPGSPCRREACRALLRDAIHAMNAGRLDAAAEELREVLAAEPTNLKANYALQLTLLRSGGREELADLVRRYDRVYQDFQALSRAAVVSAAHWNRVAAALDEDDAPAARRAHRKSLSP